VSLGSRLRERLGSVNPLSLGMLGFVGIPGELFPQLEILKVFNVFWLFWLWPFAAMLVGSITQSLGVGDADEAGPRDWLAMDEGWRGQVAFLLGVPLSVLNPVLLRQDATQLLGSAVAVLRHRGSLPDPDTHTQSVGYRLPVEGTWTVVNGSPIKEYSHSWFPATQRYAYDFVITDDEGRSRPAGTDTSPGNYYCYDEPVLAPADGVVVDVHDGDPELGRAGGFSHPLKRTVTGNAVTIRHAEGEYSSLVHLVPGSIAVDPGERVERGQRIGRCGHSGNSAEPHLHFQVQDHPTFEVSAGLPVRFEEVAVDTPGVDVVEATDWSDPDGGSGRYLHVGQRVTHAPDGESGGADDAAGTPEGTTPAGLAGVRTLGRVATGLSVGGLLTVGAGFVAASLQTVAVVLAGLVGLGLAYLVATALFDDRLRPGSVGTVGGVGVAAALVGGFDSLSGLPGLSSSAVGTGLFLAGVLLYVAVWEYGRRGVLPDSAAANRAVE
jgi:murein DD-endopeptidase MepM/ murein hydrolase activator NlpD